MRLVSGGKPTGRMPCRFWKETLLSSHEAPPSLAALLMLLTWLFPARPLPWFADLEGHRVSNASAHLSSELQTHSQDVLFGRSFYHVSFPILVPKTSLLCVLKPCSGGHFYGPFPESLP